MHGADAEGEPQAEQDREGVHGVDLLGEWESAGCMREWCWGKWALYVDGAFQLVGLWIVHVAVLASWMPGTVVLFRTFVER